MQLSLNHIKQKISYLKSLKINLIYLKSMINLESVNFVNWPIIAVN